MTEQEWLACTDADPMVKFLRWRWTKSRKLRLFCVACCRRIWHLMGDERSREAVELAEQFIEGKVDGNQLWSASFAARSAATESTAAALAAYKVSIPGGSFYSATESIVQDIVDAVVDSADQSLHPDIQEAKRQLQTALDEVRSIHAAADDARCRSSHTKYAQLLEQGKAAKAKADAAQAQLDIVSAGVLSDIDKNERAALAHLLRDIVGNPFRDIIVDPSWLTPTVTALAQTIYDKRHFEDLPILADALEEAGCTDEDILGHCRGEGLHARGCWVVDLLLPKV